MQEPVVYYRAEVGQAVLVGREARRNQKVARLLAGEPARLVRVREVSCDVLGETKGKRKPRPQACVVGVDEDGKPIKGYPKAPDVPPPRMRRAFDLVLHNGTVVLDAPRGKRVGGWDPAPTDGEFGAAAHALIGQPLPKDFDAEEQSQAGLRRVKALAKRASKSPEEVAKAEQEEAARQDAAREEHAVAARLAVIETMTLAVRILKEELVKHGRTEDLPYVVELLMANGEEWTRERVRQIAAARDKDAAQAESYGPVPRPAEVTVHLENAVELRPDYTEEEPPSDEEG